jgi:hypothetical protein
MFREASVHPANVGLPAAMCEGPQCRFEERPTDSVEDDLRSLTLSQTAGG